MGCRGPALHFAGLAVSPAPGRAVSVHRPAETARASVASSSADCGSEVRAVHGPKAPQGRGRGRAAFPRGMAAELERIGGPVSDAMLHG